LAFDRISPIGDERGDIHASIVASTMANIHRGKNQKPYAIKDFMPFAEKKTESDDQILLNFKRLAKK